MSSLSAQSAAKIALLMGKESSTFTGAAASKGLLDSPVGVTYIALRLSKNNF